MTGYFRQFKMKQKNKFFLFLSKIFQTSTIQTLIALEETHSLVHSGRKIMNAGLRVWAGVKETLSVCIHRNLVRWPIWNYKIAW
jgi:hypothetical protein